MQSLGLGLIILGFMVVFASNLAGGRMTTALKQTGVKVPRWITRKTRKRLLAKYIVLSRKHGWPMWPYKVAVYGMPVATALMLLGMRMSTVKSGTLPSASPYILAVSSLALGIAGIVVRRTVRKKLADRGFPLGTWTDISGDLLNAEQYLKTAEEGRYYKWLLVVIWIGSMPASVLLGFVAMVTIAQR
jgi:hypothetical protein